MIKLKLSFGKDEVDQELDIEKGELLKAAVERTCQRVPRKEEQKLSDIFNVVVNGNIIEPEFWEVVNLEPTDVILIAPKIKDGDAGQLFKQALLIVVTVVASYFLTPAGGATLASSLAVAGVTIGATLLLNALIPPPVPDLGGLGDNSIDQSQMYSISGQSNQAKQLGVVPKVYGTHRVFPTVAANPYIELAVDPLTGEVIQYLVAIYDFGLGTPQISEIQIGDTPLTTDDFKDFEYYLVDLNLPDEVDQDEFDTGLRSDFKLYKGDRHSDPLGVALIDGGEVVRNSAENTDGVEQEIILDFVCPAGLFGYSSGGTKGDRAINLTIEFAEVGTSDWKAWNDGTQVLRYKGVGGTDFTDFTSHPVPLLLDHPLYSTYYVSNFGMSQVHKAREDLNIFPIYMGYHTSFILVPKPDVFFGEKWQWQVGSSVYGAGEFMGVISAVTDLGPTYPNWMRVDVGTQITGKTNLHAYDLVQHQSIPSITPPVTPYYTTSPYATLQSTSHVPGAGRILGSSTTAVYGSFRFTPKNPGQYKVRVRRISTQGDFTFQTGDDLTWAGITTAFHKAPITTDKRHVFMEVRIKATDQLNGNIQNLSAIAAQPLQIYDPDTQTWARDLTKNPAWVFVDLLTGEVNKKAVTKERLDLDSIIEWRDYCDQVPTAPPGQTFTYERFLCNFILDYTTTLQEVIGQVCSGAQASLNLIDGKYGILIDKFKDVPVQIFTPRNSTNFSSTRFYSTQPDALKVKFVDPNMNWNVNEVVVYDNGFDELTAVEFEEITSFACTNVEQAWRFGRYMMAQNKLRQETITIQVDFENLICTRGDYVQLTQDVMQVGGRPARVKSVAGSTITIDDGLDIGDIAVGYTYRNPAGEFFTSTCTPTGPRTFVLAGAIPAVGDLIVIGEVGKLTIDCIVKAISPNDDMSASITLVERANEIFDYESTNAVPTYDPQFSMTSNPDFTPPAAVEDLTLTANTQECAQTQSGYNYYAQVGWNTPTGSVYELFEIWVNDGRGYKALGTTINKYFKFTIDQTRLGIEHGVKVVAVSASGKKLQLIAMSEITFTPEEKSTPPSDVINFGMSITNQVLQLAWSQISDCDVAKYELRYSPEVNDIWEASVPLQVVDRNISSISVQARTGVYFIKALDFAGNKSTNAAQANTTIPNLFDLNIIEELNDSPGFAGLMEQAELFGEAVILSERVTGTVDTMQYYTDGYYNVTDIIDLGDIYSARLQSLIRADGYKFGEVMVEWDHLADVDHLSTAESDDWTVGAEYRATNEILAMSSWVHLYSVAHLNEGLGQGFTDWRPIPTIGDATGRVFQFRIHLQSITPNVTPRLFDATIKIDMPDRSDSFENQVSSASDWVTITYESKFNGPGTSPNIQISIDNGATGDYYTFGAKTLEGFQIKFFNSVGAQVVRQFDVVAKGFGKRHTVTL